MALLTLSHPYGAQPTSAFGDKHWMPTRDLRVDLGPLNPYMVGYNTGKSSR